ncbi:PAS domain-containing hybrid sensor histidine kinase/response regulator [Candidatus Magnetomonas plexicatena]|uniref:PAS domain-containing hybrid sensor histidine kinase/response regulator n=1 Tax=Candidatus Magnetomonas plexicatena TaxID=2552947 RepID=UPI001C772AEC|nr:response regulator [Nitrospirales bacterium LBB_01]
MIEAHESCELLEAIADNVHAVIYLKDTSCRYLMVNRRFEYLFKKSKEDVSGKTDSEIFDSHYGEPFHADDLRVIESGSQIETEDIIHHPQGVNTYLTTRFPLFNKSRVVYAVCGISVDITGRKQVEEERIRSGITLEGTSKIKSAFLANMSHEIRTPLNGIIGMTELVLDTNLDSEQREYLMMVKNSSGYLLGILNSILDFSRIEAGRIEIDEVNFDLVSTISDIIEPFVVQALKKGIKLSTEISKDVPVSLKGDVGRLKQVFVNLIGNALKFTENGKIELKVGVAPATFGKRIFPPVSNTETRLLFSVSDTGIGIPKEKFELIFDSFTQGEVFMTKKYEGTGLGLAIVKKVLYMLGGDIWVESEPGKGSTFYFTARFSLHKTAPLTLPQIEKSEVKSRRILVVDSNPSSMLGLSEMIKSDGFIVETAPNGQSAISMLSKPGAGFDGIVLDFQLIDIDGFDFARKIKSELGLNSLKIIMLVSAGLKGDATVCREIGVSGYLVKPIYKSDLVEVLSLAIERGDNPAAQLLTRHTVRELRGPQNILVAEDNIVNQTLAVRLLQKRGYTPHVAGNGHEVLDLLEKQSFDIILMDVEMPEMDGLEATRYIRRIKDAKINAGIPIIAMTAHALKGDMELCLAAGMDDYISKPLRAEDLYTLIEKYTGVGHNDAQIQEIQTKSQEIQVKPEPPVLRTATVSEKLSVSLQQLMATQQPSTRTSAKSLYIKETLERLEFDEETLRDIWTTFVSDVPKQMAYLTELYDNGDISGLQKQVRLIKDMSVKIGATALKSESFRMELALRKISTDFTDAERITVLNFIERLKIELDIVIRDIKTNLAKPAGTIA